VHGPPDALTIGHTTATPRIGTHPPILAM
jgi:hypothetical protein